MKQCNKCGESKPLDQFHKSPKSKDLLKSTCKPCACAITRKWHADNRARASARSREYRAANPNAEVARGRKYRVANAERVRRRRREYRAANLDSVRERGRIWAESNPDRVKAYMRQWQVANPEALQLHQRRRRARKVGNGVFVVTVEEIRRMLGQPCYLCNNAQSTAIDHIIPIAKGGRHSIGNLLGSCRLCNLRKGTKFLFEFKVRRRVLP